MLHQSTSAFGPIEQALALALHQAGSTDTEIGLGIGVSVNNIIDWRKREGLDPNYAVGTVETYTSPVRRSAPDTKAVAISPRAAAVAPPALISPAQAVTAFYAPVQPTGDNAIEIGLNMDAKVYIDLEELLTTRLLVQGNSGSGKSHLLRKIIEESTGIVQQVIIDPEGDFVGLAEAFGMTVIDASAYNREQMADIGLRVRKHRGSAVVNLEPLEIEQQMERAAAFLDGVFDAPREFWTPVLVFVDEAHLFASTVNGGEDAEIRRACLSAMTNLMCRGRKRGLAGVLATQRLAKLHKNVAGEASNFLMGRTFLDIDIARAAELLGLQRRDMETIRDLTRGEFLGLGPAIAKRPLKVKIGPVETAGQNAAAHGLLPLPTVTADELQGLILPTAEEEGESKPAPLMRVVR